VNDVFHKAKKHLRDPRERPLDAARAWLEELADDPHPDLYGNGAVLEDFEAEISRLLGKPAGVFLPSGIMAQQIALRIWSERTGRAAVGMHPRAHLQDKEQRAIEVVHGLRTVSLGARSRLITLEDLEGCGERLGSLLLELPQRELGGELPSWDELDAQCAWARERGTWLHLDGARLWECAAWASYPDICALFDSVYVSFYKGLDGVAGAMLLGSEDFIAEARVWQRRLGGNLIHMWPLVASARRGLRERLPKMSTYVARARDVAKIFNGNDSVVVRPEEPSTPMFHAFFERDAAALTAAAEKLAAEERVVLFTRAADTEIPGWSRVEIPCYERALEFEDEAIYLSLHKLLEWSR
jgi:threonine aldolase